ncbi:uncharacterized protein AMSG_11772 [Thecamonas trahens ATCC 50062]|uniref:Uncharacterized protein n=1 Tax=Thecamonas trahens ATCC 50062 TaxID=461836 RepID=A0A0L0D4F8_THETB|nr:hypothetical protein AMSG_11772 [Thecamonas trahens ATCC 50062]KNC47115.1 hypothetical protein AMSG_11772 [Thecamonas trahens ATCC 50062]|eukprot:XP_013760005.1 hypothetical protein AMSG_11772 [Thecamonas trahens ATCC 50062]
MRCGTACCRQWFQTSPTRTPPSMAGWRRWCPSTLSLRCMHTWHTLTMIPMRAASGCKCGRWSLYAASSAAETRSAASSGGSCPLAARASCSAEAKASRATTSPWTLVLSSLSLLRLAVENASVARP